MLIETCQEIVTIAVPVHLLQVVLLVLHQQPLNSLALSANKRYFLGSGDCYKSPGLISYNFYAEISLTPALRGLQGS